MVQVSPPDKHGFCSLGVSVDCSVSAVKEATKVIAQINPNMPRTHGAGFLHYSAFDAVVQVNDPLPEKPKEEPSKDELRIGEHIATLIENGATLQMGIGSIPDAVLRSLKLHKELGIHTEMVSDGVIDLIEEGVITNEHKDVAKNVILFFFFFFSFLFFLKFLLHLDECSGIRLWNQKTL